MKRRHFVAASLLTTAGAATGAAFARSAPPAKELYELRVYDMRYGSPASGLENYLKDALIPALNRLGIKTVGVFREMGKSDPAKLYLLIPHPSLTAYANVAGQLTADAAFAIASQPYTAIGADKPPFSRYTTSLLNAFDVLPNLLVPATGQPRMFELRTYEGYSEDAVRRKVKMFNVDEMPIFYRVKLNPVFFGEVIAGPNMPCLAYMLTFKDMAERDANWKLFSADPDWKRISAAPEYANSVSNIIRVFLEPAAFSQI
jgi:hypothetical protein